MFAAKYMAAGIISAGSGDLLYVLLFFFFCFIGL